MPIGVAIAASAVLGYVASENATAAAAEAARASNDGAVRSAQLQYDLGKESLDFSKEYYKDVVKPAADFDLNTRKELVPRLIEDYKDQSDFAADQRQYYTDFFQPIEKRMIGDAQLYDSAANVNRRMGIAAANVNQQYSNAAGQQARTLTRYGINPNSSAFARANANLTNQQALASAGMQTGAAFDTMDKAIALRAGAANFGRNMPNTAAQFGQVGNQTSGNASGTTGAGVNTAVNAGNFMGQGYGIAGGLNGSAAGIYNNNFRNNVALGQMQSQGVGQLFSGIGQGLGMWGQGGFKMPSFSGFGGAGSMDGTLFDAAYAGPIVAADGGHVGELADRQNAPRPTGALTLPPAQRLANGGQPVADEGGVVRGPGGPRDDAVPAMLSRNEFVLNEGAVKHFGLDKLNKMNSVGLENQARRGLIRSA